MCLRWPARWAMTMRLSFGSGVEGLLVAGVRYLLVDLVEAGPSTPWRSGCSPMPPDFWTPAGMAADQPEPNCADRHGAGRGDVARTVRDVPRVIWHLPAGRSACQLNTDTRHGESVGSLGDGRLGGLRPARVAPHRRPDRPVPACRTTRSPRPAAGAVAPAWRRSGSSRLAGSASHRVVDLEPHPDPRTAAHPYRPCPFECLWYQLIPSKPAMGCEHSDYGSEG